MTKEEILQQTINTNQGVQNASKLIAHSSDVL